MLRIMIVDDEPVIRFGIKASVDWEKEGFVVIGDYANGAEALERLKSDHVDILITDIKMPVMDGLTLTQHALRLDPRIKVILVSSYNDFEYVHQGLKLGVVDYILKHTLEPDELLATVQKCSEIISEEVRLENRLVDAHEHVSARLRARYAKVLKRFLAGNYHELPVGGYPDWLNESYTAVYIRLNGVRGMEETYGFLYPSIMVEACVEAIYSRLPASVVMSTEACECFVLLSGQTDIDHLLTQISKELSAEIGTAMTFGYQLGLGVEHIQDCFKESKEACTRDFFEGAGIYRYDNSQPRLARTGCHLPSMLPVSHTMNDEIFERIVAEWKADWVKGGTTPAALKEEACRVLSMMYKYAVDSFALVEAFEQLFESESLNGLCDCLIDQFAGLGRHVGQSPELSNPVEKALGYIQTHYLESVTLQQVADYVHVSKNYLSILFKKTMSQNFIDYLIDLRIRRAKELLIHPELRIYEVAEQAGFNDVKYFSKLFKKITGLSPIDYREYHLLSRNPSVRSDRNR
jgi:two-component system, response regulator YesN